MRREGGGTERDFVFLGLFAKTQFVIFLLVMISIISCLASGYHVIIM